MKGVHAYAYLEAGHCSSILPVQVEAHLGDLAFLNPQLLQHVLCNLATRYYTASLQARKMVDAIDLRAYPVCSCGMLG